MSGPERASLAHRVADGSYRGVWLLLRDWFRVPSEPPSLPVPHDGGVRSFRPAPGFLRYLSLQFWIALAFFDGLILVAWILLTIAMPLVGALLALPALVIAIVPDIIAYVAIHLRYDTTWYVMSDRSIRLRRGIWIIQEITITFENVQNVSVSQGPLQRYFGIADLTIQTAGGGGMGAHGAPTGGHVGLVEGISDAEALRDLIMAKVKASRHAGLGDERQPSASTGVAWGPEHLDALRGIRDALVRPAPSTG